LSVKLHGDPYYTTILVHLYTSTLPYILYPTSPLHLPIVWWKCIVSEAAGLLPAPTYTHTHTYIHNI
jgi:hypothetical protein